MENGNFLWALHPRVPSTTMTHDCQTQYSATVQQFLRKGVVPRKRCAEIRFSKRRSSWVLPEAGLQLRHRRDGFPTLLSPASAVVRAGDLPQQKSKGFVGCRCSAEKLSWRGALSCLWRQHFFGNGVKSHAGESRILRAYLCVRHVVERSSSPCGGSPLGREHACVLWWCSAPASHSESRFSAVKRWQLSVPRFQSGLARARAWDAVTPSPGHSPCPGLPEGSSAPSAGDAVGPPATLSLRSGHLTGENHFFIRSLRSSSKSY